MGCVQLLLRNAANPALKNDEGETPLDVGNALARGAIAAALAARTHSFRQLQLCETLQAGLADMGMERPSHVQALTLPLMLARPKQHLLVQAPNDSGKTLAMLLGMLAKFDAAQQQLSALCVCPTRELVTQHAAQAGGAHGYHLHHQRGAHCARRASSCCAHHSTRAHLNARRHNQHPR
jgi:hypothetical protein